MAQRSDARVLIVGPGSVGFRIAEMLATRGLAGSILMAGPFTGVEAVRAAITESSGRARVRFIDCDASDPRNVIPLLRQERPDLVVNSASLLSPWALIEREDALGKTLKSVGIGLQLPSQLPVLLGVMRAVAETGLPLPVANISFPDLTGHILGRLGLAPTIGLGNVTFIQMRAEAALRREAGSSAPPFLRVIAQHAQVYDVLQGRVPENADLRCRVFLGEAATRADELAYAGPPIPATAEVNALAAAAAVRVIAALLRGDEQRLSAPAPGGRVGGYPVRIDAGRVTLDLPAGVDLAACEKWHWRLMQQDGVQAVEEDGTVIFTDAARQAVAALDPELCTPLRVRDLRPRFDRLRAVLYG
jgi:hypothetical protein